MLNNFLVTQCGLIHVKVTSPTGSRGLFHGYNLWGDFDRKLVIMEPGRGGTTYILTLAQFGALVNTEDDNNTVSFKKDITSIKELKKRIKETKGITGVWHTHTPTWGAHVVSAIAKLSSGNHNEIPVAHSQFAKNWVDQYYSAKKPEAEPNEIELAKALADNIIAETDGEILKRQPLVRGKNSRYNRLDL